MMNQSVILDVHNSFSSALGVVDYIVILIMLLISSGIGLYFRFSGGKQKTTLEFLMAGKNMSVFPVSLSIMASGKSAVTYLGLPSDMYLYGTYYAFVDIGNTVGALVAGYLFLPVYFKINSCTTYEYLEKRFGSSLRRVCSFTFSLQTMLYIAVILYAPSLALSAVTGLSVWASVLTVGVCCTFYCTLGGMKAVLWTDVFQGFLMFTGIIAMVIKGTYDVGGVDVVMSRAKAGGRWVVPSWEMDLTTRYTFFNVFFAGFISGLSAYGTSQLQVQRMLTVSSAKKARCALFSSMPVNCVLDLMLCWVGLVTYANFYNCDPLSSGEGRITKPDQLLPYFSLKSLGYIPGVAGLCVCGVLSSTLSSLSSLVNSLTAVTVEDFIKPMLGMTEAKTTILAKLITLCYGCIGLLLTYIVTSFGNVLQATAIVHGLVAGPNLGVFLLAVLTSHSNETGAIIGLISSLVFTAWISFGSASTNIGHPYLPVSTAGCNTNWTAKNVTIRPFIAEATERGIFPLYKISFMWFATIGALTSFSIGYLCSFLFGKQRPVENHLLSSVAKNLRKFSEEKGDVQLTSIHSLMNDDCKHNEMEIKDK